jgi:hypothetical protein
MSDEKNLPLNCDRDPARWAREFDDVLAKEYNLRVDEGWLIGWFANAMMCGEDTYRWKLEKEGRVHPEETFRDAERYRWLRLGNNRSAPTLGIWQEPGEGVETHYPCAEEGDAAIDAAMTAERIPQLSEGSK